MKPSVSERTISTAGLIGGLLVLWALILEPGAPWIAYVAFATLAVIAGASAAARLGRRATLGLAPARLALRRRR